MTRAMLHRLFVPVAIAIGGCHRGSSVAVAPPMLGSVVGQDELLTTGRPWLFDALRITRPSYFNSRGQTTINGQDIVPMVVVIDGVVLEDLEPLRTTPVEHVVQVRRLSVSEAYFRYHRSVSMGALEIVRRGK